MFNINDMASLRAAYSFVRTLRDVTVPVENVARRDRHIADVKREIREFTHRAASRSHIVRDDGIDGYVELVQLPEALDEAELRVIVSFACKAAGLSTTKHGGISSVPDSIS